MYQKIGKLIFKIIIAIPALHRFVNKRIISSYTDNGPLPGLYNAGSYGKTSLWEMLHKSYFALEVPTPSQDEIDNLPPVEEVVKLFERKDPSTESRVSLLLPLFAQHLTDAVFQSDGQYGTNAPHEIILNQIYGNTPVDEKALRLHEDGKLRTQKRAFGTLEAEFPDSLFEQKEGKWQVKDIYKDLSYLRNEKKIDTLLTRYKDREQDVCATGLFQGNLTLGNFAITTLLVREHNRLCDGIIAEKKRKRQSYTDQEIFRVAQQNNVTAYMKVVIEDYINAFAGQKIFMLDTKSFFHEAKRWCRETPIPYHFNILYRLHCMMPDTLKGFEKQGFEALRANNNLVMDMGIGKILEITSSQGASHVCLGNTHKALLEADRGGVTKARGVLGFFNQHREAQETGSSVGFDAFDPKYRDQLKQLYKDDPARVEYAVGILAELPKPGFLEKVGFKDDPILGPTLMAAIAKHAFRHILSNRFMTREYLNKDVLTDFGWDNLHNTSSVEDLVKRNVSGEISQSEANNLNIGFANSK